MSKYHTRYVKEHYVKRDIKRELYEAFIEWCGEKSINICLEKALSILRGNVTLNVRGNIAPNTHASPAQTVQSTNQSKAKPGERKRVIVFTLEWAKWKGINVEEYMARREREGYVCNETSREIVCVWRELLEEIVVELNDAGVKMGELDRALSGEKLETAKIAERAGLLWYDAKEKRWRAPL
jgi:hypothetical protein